MRRARRRRRRGETSKTPWLNEIKRMRRELIGDDDDDEDDAEESPGITSAASMHSPRKAPRRATT
eukprot:3483106-Pyramimonas_sp.AAC.1